MQFTAIGAVSLICMISVLTWRKIWFLAILPLFAVMQTQALAIVTIDSRNYGVSIINGAMFCAGFYIILSVLTKDGRRSLQEVINDKVFKLWVVFVVVCVVGAFVLPRIFEGMLVIQMFDNELLSEPMKPLQPNINHLAQSINAIGNLVCFILAGMLAHLCGRERAVRSMAIGFVAAGIVTAVIGTYQRACYLGFCNLDITLWSTNPSLHQSFDSIYGSLYGIRRVALPFIEPSYAGAWFAALAAAALAMLSLSKHWLMALASLLLLVSALFNTIAATGIIAFIGFISIYFFISILASIFAIFRNANKLNWPIYRPLVVCVAMTAIIGVGLVASPTLRGGAVEIADKVSNFNSPDPIRGSRSRGEANTHALTLAINTTGLGVGMGSNRASGFLHGLLGNVGFLGVIFFLAALVIQTSRTASYFRKSSTLIQYSFISQLAGLICLLMSMAGGIADQNWPVLWVTLLFGFLLSLPEPIHVSGK